MTPEPAVACVNPVFRSKRYPSGMLSARSLFAATLVTLSIVAVLRRPNTSCAGSLTKPERAKLTVAKYAYEAYPQWAMAHPERICPRSLTELDAFTVAEHKDPWGHGYAFTCGDGRLFVVSLGPDGKAATGDDVWSHE